MPKFSVDEIHTAYQRQRNIRNITICAHVDSGKTTVTDSLLNRAGIISDKDTGEKRATDTRADEQERVITIKSTGISLYYELSQDLLCKVPDNQGSDFLINLIDSPGHVDFSSEVTAALRVTDGALVILDGIKGVCVQTETVLRQALDEMIKPICFINKLDRLILELKLNPEEMYQKMFSQITHLNSLIQNYNKKMPMIELKPEEGTVAFGCGKMGWGFTLMTFARKWAPRMGVSADELVKKLWGEHYFDPKTKQWYTTREKGTVRGFNYFVLATIIQIHDTIMEKPDEEAKKLIANMKIKLSDKDRDLMGKELLKPVMQKFIPCSDALLESICVHLPSPVEAQSYRVDHLYTGPKDDLCYNGIKNCDPNGPLVMYVSKLFPSPDLSRFFAFGRIFSGTIKPGPANIQGPCYIVGEKDDFRVGKIQTVAVMMGAEAKPLPNCPAGNTCALIGIDKDILKTATVTDSDTSHNIIDMKFTVAPVVSVAVTCKRASDIDKLSRGLKLLSKSDPLCLVHQSSETGETIISGAGELHLEICVHDLETMFAKGVELKISDPVVPFRETVAAESQQICLAKSSNKHNRIYISAAPVEDELLVKLENREITGKMDQKQKIKILTTEFGWSKDDAIAIWDISAHENNNMFIDKTKAVQYLHEVKGAVLASFNNNCVIGPLTGEPIRGVKFMLHDGVFHSDSVHRGGDQIMPAARRAMYASMYTAGIRLMEPIYVCEIQCPIEVVGKVYSVMTRRRGTIIDETDAGMGQIKLKGYLPVAESIGFTAFLRSETGGKAFPQCSFSHWDIISQDPLDPNTKANEIVREIRKRKGMPEEIPQVTRYLDKL
jgi:elongation factor 2